MRTTPPTPSPATPPTPPRLLGAARAGRVLVGPRTYRRARHAFLFEPREPLRLRGKAGHLDTLSWWAPGRRRSTGRAWRSGDSLAPDRARRGLAGAVLRLGRLAAGEGGLVAVLGDAGVGKTRLLAEARARRGRGLEAGWPDGGRSPGWWGARSPNGARSATGLSWRSCAGTQGSPKGRAQASLARLRARLQALFPRDAEEVLPYLATLLSLPLPGETAALCAVPGRGRGATPDLPRGAVLYVQRLTLERPLVLVFEDLHWVDQSSAALLETSCPWCGSTPC